MSEYHVCGGNFVSVSVIETCTLELAFIHYHATKEARSITDKQCRSTRKPEFLESP